MPENTLALFGALQLFFSDIVKGLIPAHVAAFILRHIREHNAVPLEDVPIADWLSINPKDTNELYSEFSLLCKDVHDGKLDAVEATGQIESVHSHIQQARERIMEATLEELGFEKLQREFLDTINISRLKDLVERGTGRIISLRGNRSYDLISRVLEKVRTIYLILPPETSEQAA